MRLVSLVFVAVFGLCLMASDANAACKGKAKANVNRVANVAANVLGNVNAGLRQVVAGNQLVTLDRFGNVVQRQFLNRNNALLNRNSLAERLLLGL